jgi:LmbE family N-acetylglucosaminyl deacetylase
VIRKTREWQADIVMAFHPVGGSHADNRTAGEAVRDAAAFIAFTPNIVPEVPPLSKSPLFLLTPDYHAKRFYRPDIVIAVDAVLEKKLDAIAAHGRHPTDDEIRKFFPMLPAPV